MSIYNTVFIVVGIILIDLLLFLLLKNVKCNESDYDGYFGFGFVLLYRRFMNLFKR